MTVPVARPPRTAAHAERDRLLAQFAERGLVPIVSTNGGIPTADIQLVKALFADGGKHGELLECWLTERGTQRLNGEGQG